MGTRPPVERSERLTGSGRCLYCGKVLPADSRGNRRFCDSRCRRLDFDERGKVGRVASVRRLKSGKMSVVVHLSDTGLRPGDEVKVG